MPMTAFMGKLTALDSDKLNEIKAHIDKVLASRFDTTIRPGRFGYFISKQGSVVEIVVTQINRTTASCEEVAETKIWRVGTERINVAKKWRVGLNMLKMHPVERKAALPMAASKVAHRPATMDGSW